jgi:hypothetical protein
MFDPSFGRPNFQALYALSNAVFNNRKRDEKRPSRA